MSKTTDFSKILGFPTFWETQVSSKKYGKCIYLSVNNIFRLVALHIFRNFPGNFYEVPAFFSKILVKCVKFMKTEDFIQKPKIHIFMTSTFIRKPSLKLQNWIVHPERENTRKYTDINWPILQGFPLKYM